MWEKFQLKLYIISLSFIFCFSVIYIFGTNALAIPTEGLKVGTTYYGGHYDQGSNKWFIDNHNQCNRIRKGEFTAASLAAELTKSCNDDPGVGYLNDTPLHNRVSYAELSNDYENPDYSALGNLHAGAKLQIQYRGRCLVAEKLDVGTGGPSVNGYHRSLDLWWQTARSLNFHGLDVVTIKSVPGTTPLTPIGQSYACDTLGNQTEAVQQYTGQGMADNSGTAEEQITGNKKAQKKTKKQIRKPGLNTSGNSYVLGSNSTTIPPIPPINNFHETLLWTIATLVVFTGVPAAIYKMHS